MDKHREQELLARIGELEAENAELRRQLQALRERLEQAEQEARRQRRQATPFARTPPSPEKSSEPPPERKRPGRKPGEGRFAYRKRPQQVDETIDVPLAQCPECGGPLQDRKRHEQFEQDLDIRVRTRCYVTQSGYCQHCGERQRSRHPGQVSDAHGAAGVHVGPNVLALASDLKHRLGVPFEKLSDVLCTHFGFSVTRGGLCRADARLAERAAPVYRELVQAMRAACVMHVDETGWRIGSLSAWLWVFTNSKMTVYEIDPTRSHEVVVRILGGEFRGTITCDCFSAYDHQDLSNWLQQKCVAHLLDDLKALQAGKAGRALAFARQVTCLLQRANKLRDLLPPRRSDRAWYYREAKKLDRELDELIAPHRRFSDPDNARMAKRLRKQRAHLLRFLYDHRLEATNNRAERMLRPAVITRKTNRCNKTQRGADTHKILASIFTTCRQQQRDAAAYITSLLTGTAPSLVPAPALARQARPP
jgi:hypothetical protein